MSRPARIVKVDGKKVSVADIAERLGITTSTAHKRIDNALLSATNLTWKALGEGAPLSRAQQIVRCILGHGRPATLDDVVGAMVRLEKVPDEARLRFSTGIAAQLLQLCKAGKLTREGEPRHYTYVAAAEALVDRRKATSPTAAAPKRERAKAKPARPTPAAKLKKPAPTTATSAAAKRPGEFRIVERPAPVVVPNANLMRPREAALDSTRIAADIAAFQASGGRVERLPNGMTSTPTKCFLAAQAAARRRHADNDDTLDADDLVDVA